MPQIALVRHFACHMTANGSICAANGSGRQAGSIVRNAVAGLERYSMSIASPKLKKRYFSRTASSYASMT